MDLNFDNYPHSRSAPDLTLVKPPRETCARGGGSWIGSHSAGEPEEVFQRRLNAKLSSRTPKPQEGCANGTRSLNKNHIKVSG